MGTPQWSAAGGSIGSDGLYVAENAPGFFTVKAESNGLEGIAEVRIAIPSQPGGGGGGNGGDPPSPSKSIHWQGEVPQ